MSHPSQLESILSCPFFAPLQKAEALAWIHPSRLPLGTGWTGHCSAPGNEGVQPTDEELRELCNLGYAVNCARLPQQRLYDAVRFSVSRETGSHLSLWFVCESAYRPVSYGTLHYDGASDRWLAPHPDQRIQKLAECYVQTYLARRVPADNASVTS
jgi:hypothetical protein